VKQSTMGGIVFMSLNNFYDQRLFRLWGIFCEYSIAYAVLRVKQEVHTCIVCCTVWVQLKNSIRWLTVLLYI